MNFFLFLGVKHFCPSLSQINGVQKSGFSEISKKRAIQITYCSFFSQISQTLTTFVSTSFLILGLSLCFIIFNPVISLILTIDSLQQNVNVFRLLIKNWRSSYPDIAKHSLIHHRYSFIEFKYTIIT